MKIYIERKISAAHHLPNYDGKCSQLHGHTWRIQVWIEGEPLKESGMVVDFKDVKNVIDEWDHEDLNDFLVNPTAELMVAELIQRFIYELQNPTLESIRVRVWESDTCYAEDSMTWIIEKHRDLPFFKVPLGLNAIADKHTPIGGDR